MYVSKHEKKEILPKSRWKRQIHTRRNRAAIGLYRSCRINVSNCWTPLATLTHTRTRFVVNNSCAFWVQDDRYECAVFISFHGKTIAVKSWLKCKFTICTVQREHSFELLLDSLHFDDEKLMEWMERVHRPAIFHSFFRLDELIISSTSILWFCKRMFH